MDQARRRSSRRNARANTPIDSSSDELAAASDHEEIERQPTSWSAQKKFTPQRANLSDRRYSESESPDELAVDAEEYWRTSGNRRSPSPINRPTDSSSHTKRFLDVVGGMSKDQGGDLDDVRTTNSDAMSDRSTTPVPAVTAPPPKPESLKYREKFVLQGHRRGVSAVQFSPDCTMIASAGMSFCFEYLEVPLLTLPRR